MNTMKRTLALLPLVLLMINSGCGTSATTPSNTPGLPGAEGRAQRSPEETAPVKASDPLWESRRTSVRLTAKGKPAGHFWATIHKVELLGGAQGETTLGAFQDDSGVTLDLAALSEKSLPLAQIPLSKSEQITRIRVTLGGGAIRFVGAVPVGEQVSLSETLPRDAAGRPTILLTLPKAMNPDAPGGVTLAFDLDKLAPTGDKTPVALSVAETAPAEGMTRELFGTVRGVLGDAPGQRALVGDQLVYLAPDTILTATGNASPKLTEGQNARLRVALDPASGKLMVRAAMLGASGEALATGKIKSVDAAAGTLTIALEGLDGALPMQSTLAVTLTEDATLRHQGCVALDRTSLWKAATPGAKVRVEGVYEPVTGTFAASRLALDEGATTVVTLSAPVAAADAKALTLGPLTIWDGFAPPAKGVSARLSETTALIGDDGASAKIDAFLPLAKERGVKLLGLLGKDGSVTASRIELLPKLLATPTPAPTPEAKPSPEPEKKPAEADKKLVEKKEIVSP